MKAKGYWRVWENVEAELKTVIAGVGRFPSKSELERTHSSVAAAIVMHHGGFPAVRARMGFEEFLKLPNGHWDDWENARAEIERLRGVLGKFPSGRDFKAHHLTSLYGAIARTHGGMTAVRVRMGSVQVRRPDGLYRDWSVIEAELRKIMETTGKFPSAKYCEEHGLSSLASGVKRFHGGFRAAREKMGCAQVRVPDGYYEVWENYEREMRAVIEEVGKFPSPEDLKRIGKSSLHAVAYRTYGGFTAVRARMGLAPPRRRVQSHWMQWENVESALKRDDCRARTLPVAGGDRPAQVLEREHGDSDVPRRHG